MQVVWQGQTWGASITSDVIVTSAIGLEDFASGASNPSGPGHGATAGALWAQPLGITLGLTIFADTDDEMDTNLAAVKGVTWADDDDPLAVHPLVFTIPGQDPYTVFARVTDRSTPTDFTTKDRFRAVSMLVRFEALDSLTYTALTTSTAINPAGTYVATSTGWAKSERWTWTVTGPATNPRITSSVDGAVVRYVGAVGSGDTLEIDLVPNGGTWELEGVDIFGSLDNGTAGQPPDFFPIVPGAQTLTYATTAGAGTSTFAWRGACP